MKTSLKKSIVILILAAFAAPTLSFAEAAYPNNKPRPTHKHHKHHSKKAAPAPAQ